MSKRMTVAKQQLEFHELITADGLVYPLNLNTTRFTWGVIGEGLPRATIRTQRAPFQHGVTPVSIRYEPRSITMTMQRNADNQHEYYSVRSDLINHFRLNRQTVQGGVEPAVLRKYLPNGSLRDMLVYIDTGLLFQTPGIDEFNDYNVTEVIRFFCPNPFYFNPVSVQTSVTYLAITDLIFPVEGTISFGSASAVTDTVTYNGTQETFPTVKFVGPSRNPVLVNLDTGKKLELNYVIPSGDTITVALTDVSMTIQNSAGDDLKGILTEDSDPDFTLVPDPLAPGGVNSLSAAATGVSGITDFVLTYFEMDQGY